MSCESHLIEGDRVLLQIDGGTVAVPVTLVERFDVLPEAAAAAPAQPGQPAGADPTPDLAAPAAAGTASESRAALLPAADPARPVGAPAPEAETVQQMAQRIGAEFAVDPRLVEAVIHVESRGNPNAVSPKGAGGLMQLMPGTADRFGVGDVFDPADNVRGGVRYLKWLIERFDGDLGKVLAAYNAGEGAVDRHLGIPPYRETRHYVLSVLQRYVEALRRSAGS